MSIEAYEKLAGRFELYKLLDDGESAIEKGNVKTADEVFKGIEERLNEL